jgi:hypothetical protein
MRPTASASALSPLVQGAVGLAVQQEFARANGLAQGAPPPKELKSAFDATLDDALRRAAEALSQRPAPSTPDEARAFAQDLASRVVSTPYHPSNLAVQLQLDKPLELTPAERRTIADKMTVCPFCGGMVASGKLPIYGSKENPLAKIDDIAALAGPGDLGKLVLRVFAEGNQSKMLDPKTGDLTLDCPPGFFCLHFLPSKGSHGANSGVLHEPLDRRLGMGRRSQEDFDWLKGFASPEGKLSVAGMGKAIAERMFEYQGSDPTVQVTGRAVFEAMGIDALEAAGAFGPALFEKAMNKVRAFFGDPQKTDSHHRFIEDLTTLTGKNTLVGSCGEWALLFAGWANAPGVRQNDGSLLLDMAEVEPQFMNADVPAPFENAEKSAFDWAKTTSELVVHAFVEFHRLKRGDA